MPIRRPDRLYFTGDDEADELLARDPFALLVGFALDQQVTVQTAFSGPLKLEKRLGTLDPGMIATTDPGKLEAVFREKPAIHRFPGDDGDAGSGSRGARSSRTTAATPSASGARRPTATDLRARIAALPGFGEMKVKALGAVLSKRFGVAAAAAELGPGHPTLGDVDSAEALEAYQAKKRAYKASLRTKAG